MNPTFFNLRDQSQEPTDTKRADIHVQVRELQHLFNSLDPTPFPERDLDADAEEFIVGWAREHPSHLPLRLQIHLGKPLAPGIDPLDVQESVRHYFAYRSDVLGRQLRQLLAIGRVSLVVGLVCVTVTASGAHMVNQLGESAWSRIVSESLIIGGWVAMWRPLQIFLYEWWPIRRHKSLCLRLSRAQVDLIQPSA